MNNETKEIEIFVKKILENKNKKNRFIPGKTLIPPSGKLIGYEETKNKIGRASCRERV